MERGEAPKRTVFDFTRKFTNFSKPRQLVGKKPTNILHRVGGKRAVVPHNVAVEVSRPTIDIINRVNLKKAKRGDVGEDEVDAFLQRVHEKVPLVVAEKSPAQARFRATVLKQRTPQDELRRQIVEKRTRAYLSVKLCLIGFLSLVVIYFGVRTWVGEVQVSDTRSATGGPLFVFSGVLLLSSTLLGIYGVKRVPKDLLVDDDGMGTPGQRMLEVYFHISFLYVLLMVPVAFLEILKPGSLVGEAQYDSTGVHALNASISSLVVIVVMSTALRSTVLIVTIFEMAHHFLEHFALIVAVLGCLGVALGMSLVQFSQFLFTSTFTTSLGTILFVFVALCIILVALSVIGFLGAALENGAMLRVYAMCIALVGFVLLVLVCSLSAVPFEDIIFDNCREILQTMSHDWWLDTIGCHKYGGAEIGALVEGYSEEEGYHYVVSGFGEAARCPSKDMVAYVWEANSHQTQSASGNSTTIQQPILYQGCLHEECCHVLFDRMGAVSIPLIVSVVQLIICIAVASKASLWLRGHVRQERERVKRLSKHRARVLLSAIIILCLTALVLCVSVYLTGRRQLSVDQIVQQINVEIPLNSTLARTSAHSCSNGLKDGNETDVDCGGDSSNGGCSSPCFAGKVCITDSDCESQICNATSSLCSPITLEQRCTNGVQDSLETDVDCGGAECRTLRIDGLSPESFLCRVGQKCVEDSDCASQSCTSGKCTSCNDGVKNEDEGDIDCGSATCVRYKDVLETATAEILAVENRSLQQNTSDAQGLCLDGFSCLRPDQCSSGVCYAGVCSSCLNGVVDNDESDVDCGGKVCSARCSIGQGCWTNTDCSSGWCSGSCNTGVCAIGICLSPLEYEGEQILGLQGTSSLESIFAQCSDGNLSEHETDLDCGGDYCSLVDLLCKDGDTCILNRDCKSGRCDPITLTCTNCHNGIQDGSETDVDCGGSCAKKCSENATCTQDSDCISAYFCWTEAQRVEMINALNASTEQFSIGEFYFPEPFTCQLQPKINIGVKALPYIFTHDADISEIFDMPSLAPIDEEQTSTSTDGTRRVLRGRKLFSLSRRRFPGTYVGILPRGAWRFACAITLEVEAGVNSRLDSSDDEDGSSLRVIRGRNRRRLFLRLVFGRKAPRVQVLPEKCRLGQVSMRVAFRIVLGRFCAFMRVPKRFVSTTLIPVRTVLTGKVIASCSGADFCDTAQAEGVQVKLWANRIGSCSANNSYTGVVDDCPNSCEAMETFAQCSRSCCVWNDANYTAVSSCFASNEYDAPTAFVTGEDGSIRIQWPEFDGASTKRYYLHLLLQKDGFLPLRAEISGVLPGIKTDLGDFHLLPRVLSSNQTSAHEECCTNWLFAVQANSAHTTRFKDTLSQLSAWLLNGTHPVPNRLSLATYHISASILVEDTTDRTLMLNEIAQIGEVPGGNVSIQLALKAIRDVVLPCPKANVIIFGDDSVWQEAEGVTQRTFRSRQAETNRYTQTTNLCVAPTESVFHTSSTSLCDHQLSFGSAAASSQAGKMFQQVLNASDFTASNCSFGSIIEAQPGISVETLSPTASPQAYPTRSPQHPTSSPTLDPSSAPTTAPSSNPSFMPSVSPSHSPTNTPSTSPTFQPSLSPSQHPSTSPTASPSAAPSMTPSASPSKSPSTTPTKSPSFSPSNSPTSTPTTSPSSSPSTSPSFSPSTSPSMHPTTSPSQNPSISPTTSPSRSPSTNPSFAPSFSPTSSPSLSPSTSPTAAPSTAPSASPTSSPSVSPSPTGLQHLCLKHGIEFVGGDIGWDRSASIEDCHERCGHFLTCEAYTFNPSTSICYLKGSNVEEEAVSTVVSGKKDCSVTLGTCAQYYECAGEGESCDCDGWIYYGRKLRRDSNIEATLDELVADPHASFDNRGATDVECSNGVVSSLTLFAEGDPLPRIPKKCLCVPTSCSELDDASTLKTVCQATPDFSPHLDDYCAASDCSVTDLCQQETVQSRPGDVDETQCNTSDATWILEANIAANVSYSGLDFQRGLSLSMWVSLDGISTARSSVLAALGSVSYNLQLSLDDSSRIVLSVNRSVVSTFPRFFLPTEGQRRWTHIMMTMDDLGYTKVYKDAQLFASKLLPSKLLGSLPASGHLSVGSCLGCADRTSSAIYFYSVMVRAYTVPSFCALAAVRRDSPLCTEWNPCPCDSGWMKVLEQVSCSESTNLGPLADLLFSATTVVRYDVNGAPFAFYKPLKPIARGTSFFGSLVDAFNGSVANEEFALYSSHDDYSVDAGRWTSCRPRGGGELLPFPGYCAMSYWSNRHCARSGGVDTFSYYVCVPSVVPQPIVPVYRRRQSYKLSGKVYDAETNRGLEARIDLFEGVVDDCSVRVADSNTHVSYTLGPIAAQRSSCSSLVGGNDTAKLQIINSTFTFPVVEEGTYTVCAVHEAFILGSEAELEEGMMHSLPFATTRRVVEVQGGDVDIALFAQVLVPEGAMRVVLTYKHVDDLDLNVHFTVDKGTGETCSVGPKLLSDGSCKCGGAAVTRDDKTTDLNFTRGDVAKDVIYMDNVLESNYTFYLSRPSKNPTSSHAKGRKYLNTGYCGKFHPLENGEPSQCATKAIQYDDTGLVEARPCCYRGRCTNSEEHCQHARALDYRVFTGDTWQALYRSDGRCMNVNFPVVGTSTSSKGYCPTTPVQWLFHNPQREATIRPCCNRRRLCQVHTPQACTCDSCVDFTLIAGQSEGDNESVLYPTELSEAVVTVYTAQGSQKFILPDTASSTYFDAHEFSFARTESSTYTRVLCVKGNDNSPEIFAFEAPFYFQWSRQMLEASGGDCPGRSECKFIEVSGFLAREDGIDINGRYVQRYTRKSQFRSHVGYRVLSRCHVRVDGQRIIRNVPVQQCLELCAAEPQCHGVLHWNRLLLSGTVSACRFYADPQNCGGIFLSRSFYTVFEKLHVLPSPQIWYSKMALGERVNLYRDEHTGESHRWYFDDDLLPSNGYFTYGINSQGSFPSPDRVSVWQTLVNLSESVHQLEPLNSISFRPINGKCGGDTLATVFQRDTCSQGKICEDAGLCRPFILRIRNTELCLHRAQASVVIGQCDYTSRFQRWTTNFFSHLIGPGRDAPDAKEANTTDAISIGGEESSLVYTCAIVLLEKRSRSACSLEDSFGWTTDGHFFVDRGCRATFIIAKTQEKVSCSSWGYKYNKCSLDTPMTQCSSSNCLSWDEQSTDVVFRANGAGNLLFTLREDANSTEYCIQKTGAMGEAVRYGNSQTGCAEFVVL